MSTDQSNVQPSSNDQRQLALVNDPTYGTILSFLDKFRTTLDLPLYSYQRLEDHLLVNEERGTTSLNRIFTLIQLSVIHFSPSAFD